MRTEGQGTHPSFESLSIACVEYRWPVISSSMSVASDAKPFTSATCCGVAQSRRAGAVCTREAGQPSREAGRRRRGEREHVRPAQAMLRSAPLSAMNTRSGLFCVTTAKLTFEQP